MSGPSPAVEAHGLGRDFGATRALDGFDLEVSPGRLVGLLGPNGAGKTTAMLLLSTLLRPTRGTARLLGDDSRRHVARIRRRLGLVFQEPSVDGLLTVEENLRFAARLIGLGGTDVRRVVLEALARTGLADRARQPARQLSGGWRRLTDIARATIHRPDLLILDEPTVGLDPEHRERTWKLLETERRERGATVLFSTHYLAEAERCDQVVLLARGRVVSSGSPAALKATLGEEMVELEGPDHDRLLSALRSLVSIETVIPTERGYRVGVRGSRERLAELAGLMPTMDHLAVRPVTLDDVYFARTAVTARGSGAG